MDAKPSKSGRKVAVMGVSKGTLMLARACALDDNPIKCIFDSDHPRALQAALFLGVSAVATKEQLEALRPDVVICTSNEDEPECDAFILRLNDNNLEDPGPKVCVVDLGEAESSEIPEQISAEVPELVCTLRGSNEAIEFARQFLNALSPKLSCES